MTDTLDTKTTPLVWTHDDDPEALAEDIVDTIQNAQQVAILVEDGSVIVGNVTDGFDYLERGAARDVISLLASTTRADSHLRVKVD
jgi:uncharacterized protein with ACT and thioredoxin-like domain